MLIDIGRLARGGLHPARRLLRSHWCIDPALGGRCCPPILRRRGTAHCVCAAGLRRRPTGTPPRDDRRLARTRRPGRGPANRGIARRRCDRALGRVPVAGARSQSPEFFTGFFETSVEPGRDDRRGAGATQRTGRLRTTRSSPDGPMTGRSSRWRRSADEWPSANMGPTPLPRASATEAALAGGASIAAAAALADEATTPG